MHRERVGEERGSKEMDGCPLTIPGSFREDNDLWRRAPKHLLHGPDSIAYKTTDGYEARDREDIPGQMSGIHSAHHGQSFFFHYA
jgi:hypothetical protein